MSFIRAKEIPPRSGNWYDYEVESIWNNGKPRQRHIRYIGRSARGGSSALSGGSFHPIANDTIPAIPKPATIHKMKTPAKQIASAMGMYYGGMSLDAIQQQFKQDYDVDMSESNYWNWVKRRSNDCTLPRRWLFTGFMFK